MDSEMNQNIEEAFDNLQMDTGIDIDDNDSIAETIESVNESKKRKLTRDTIKKNDPGYFMYHIIKRKTKIKIEVFATTCNVGSYIRCPYTGYRTNDKVGTAAENNYFKVNMSSIGNGHHPVILYYPSADAFERHHFITVPQYIKNKSLNNEKFVAPQSVKPVIVK